MGHPRIYAFEGLSSKHYYALDTLSAQISARTPGIRTLRTKQLEATWYTWNTLVWTPLFNASDASVLCILFY